MIDDELSPRPVKLTAHQATERRHQAEKKIGVKLPVSSYERSLYASMNTAAPKA